MFNAVLMPLIVQVYRFKFALDYFFVVLPIALTLTLLSSFIALVLTLEIIAVISLVIFLLCEYMLIAREKPPFRAVVNEVIDENHSPTIFITYVRYEVVQSLFGFFFCTFSNMPRSIHDFQICSFDHDLYCNISCRFSCVSPSLCKNSKLW